MKKNKYWIIIMMIAIPLVVGTLSGLLFSAGDEYGAMVKPPLSPPSWLFPVVWTILFALMGVSSYLVYSSDADKSEKTSALWIYGIQLLVNFFWPLFFFKMGEYLFSFIWLLILWGLVLLMILKFNRINKTAGLLQIPYIVWLTFAAYLNLAVYILNR